MVGRVLAVLVAAAMFGGVFPAVAAAGEAIHLTTQEWPPYQTGADGAVDGVSVRVVRCVLDRLGYTPEVTLQPWSRAQQMVRDGSADGFFSAAHTSARDRFATLSRPIAPETWRWYWRRDRAVDVANRANLVGSRADTAVADWLAANGYGRVQVVPTVADLIAMVRTGRVDVILSNQATIEWMLAVSGESADSFATARHSDRGLGVYFGKAFLARHPAFLERFNAETGDCRMDAHLQDGDGDFGSE